MRSVENLVVDVMARCNHSAMSFSCKVDYAEFYYFLFAWTWLVVGRRRFLPMNGEWSKSFQIQIFTSNST